MQILIAYGNKSENELRKYEKVVKDHFPQAVITSINYNEHARMCTNRMYKSNAVVVAECGRVLFENGAKLVKKCREARVPLYFVMVSHSKDVSPECELWALDKVKKPSLDKPVVQELEDEKYCNFFGGEAVLLPAYSL